MLDTSKVNNQAKSIAFIDAGVDEYQSLVKGVAEGVEAIVLESDRDGIQTITAELEKYASRHEAIEAVHIISHGSPGSLQLGNRLLNRDTLAEYRSKLGRWQEALTSTAELLLYGCNVAADMGANFVRQLSELTGAKIAASVNLTGNAAKGGDWNLDFRTGEIKAPIALMPEVVAAYEGVLATLTVTNVNDSGIGSLREAIGNAQSGDTIKFASTLANKTITLTSGQLSINKDLIIDGVDAGGLSISGNNQYRVFDVQKHPDSTPTSFTLKNAIVANGRTFETGEAGAGGGIRTANFTTLVVENSEFKNNVAGGEGGGGIFAGWQGNTTVINSKFDNNDGTPDKTERGAGAIATKSAGSLTVRNSEFTNNKGINGGAINSLLGELTVEDSTFLNNEAITPTTKTLWFGLGGAILTDGANASGTNYGPGSQGGQIVIRNSIFEGNRAFEGGAANLYAYSPDLVVVEDSSFVSNTAIKKADGKGGNGGGIWHGGSEFTISDTTFYDNSAEAQGGGLWVDKISPTEISNSTFSANRAEAPNSADGIGGAMTMNSTAQIVNTTFANNYAKNHSGALFNSPDTPGDITLTNTIFDNNSVGNEWNTLKHTNRQLIDGGNNIQFPAKEPNPNDINVTANITIADPKLGPLEEINGRLIHPLLEGSAAINAGTDTNAPTTDQLGQSRVGQVDIGAYEFADTTTTNPPTSEGQRVSGTAGNDRLDGTDGNDTVSGQEGNDVLNGYNGNDLLIGGTGADTMNGGGGDDLYIVDQSNDVINEDANAGIDTVRSDVSYNLAANIENLTLIGNNSVNGVGNSSDNRILGNAADNILNGDNGNDTITGNGGNDNFNGGSGNDVLNGGSGNDLLIGGTGADTMNGGGGDDLYIVDQSNDVINEAVNGGTDTVRSDVSYNLAANIENLTLTGNNPVNGVGNNSDNRIIGNAADNILNGESGNDTITGNGGNDTFNGGSGNDLINADNGNDLLIGGTGADTMNGGGGDDLYIVDQSNDVINEAVNGGTDTVRSDVSYNLAANIENLTLTGNNPVNGIGNNSDNRIIGNDADNILNGSDGNDTITGGAGNDTANGGAGDDLLNGSDGNDLLIGGLGTDTMNGGAGDDLYIIDQTDETINEAANGGSDTVRSNVNYTLPANVENLTFTGNSPVNGTGNDDDNRIIGNSADNVLRGGNGSDILNGANGNDILNGEGGNDALTGGAGSDRFFYNTGSSFSATDIGQDNITDFNKAENDKILLSKTTFDSLSSSAGLGFSVAAEFETVASDTAAATSDAFIVYNSNNGNLFYNPDGSAAGFGSGGLFATLNNTASLEANDFVLQS